MTIEALSDAPLYRVAQIIEDDWTSPYFGAVPYIEAMGSLAHTSDHYGLDNGDMIVRYFLSNASTWRGPVARAVKAELRKRVGL